jgi:hypothetical protein
MRYTVIIEIDNTANGRPNSVMHRDVEARSEIEAAFLAGQLHPETGSTVYHLGALTTSRRTGGTLTGNRWYNP